MAVAIGQLTRVLSQKLFPTIVDAAASNRRVRLQQLFVQGTRLSLATAVPLCAVAAVMAERIVTLWVGPNFAGSIPVLQILVLVVAIKVGVMTAQALLKGTEHHRFLAGALAVNAVVNLGLSIVLAQWLGLVGVALGTLIPAAAVLMFVVFPRACRVVGLPLLAVLRSAVWPAVWPALPAGAVVMALRQPFAASGEVAAFAAAAGVLVYSVTFYRFAVPADERRWYSARITALLRRPAMLLPLHSDRPRRDVRPASAPSAVRGSEAGTRL
jgi:Polysaccharide biosynthesis C-terminal domain